MSFIEKADLAALNGLEIVDALADNTTYLRDALRQNPIHNPCHYIWQRGTSFTSGASKFVSDRHKFRRGSNAAGATCSRQSGMTMPNPTRYACQVQRDNGNSAANVLYLTHQFESIDIEQYAGKTVYLIVEGFAGANYSEANGELTCSLYTGTGVDEVVSESAGFATGNSTQTSTKPITTTPAPIAFGPFAIPANATEMAWSLHYTPPASAAGAADYFRVTSERLVTEAKLAFSKRPQALEKILCERFFEFAPGSLSGSSSGTLTAKGQRFGTTGILAAWAFRTAKRIAPVIYSSTPTWATAFANSNTVAFFNRVTNAYTTITGALSTALIQVTPEMSHISLTAGTSFNGSVGDVGDFYINGAAAIGADAEIQ